jgi:putative membrane protein
MTKQHNALESLRKTSAKNFDKEYMDMMVKDHKEAVSKFQMASEKCDNGDVKTWAANTLPTLKMHLDSAQAIQKAVK